MTAPEFPSVVIKSPAEQRAEAAHDGRDIAEILEDYYQTQRLTQAEIARKLRVSRSTVVEWMHRHDVATGYNKAKS